MSVAFLSAKRSDREYERIAAVSGESVTEVVLRDRVAFLERRHARLTGAAWVDCRKDIPDLPHNAEKSINWSD